MSVSECNDSSNRHIVSPNVTRILNHDSSSLQIPSHLNPTKMPNLISNLASHPGFPIALALWFSIPLAYILIFRPLHRSLSRSTTHTTTQTRLTPSLTQNISSIPASAFNSPHTAIHDCAYRTVPASLVPDLLEQELLKLYLRHTMGTFSSKFPQAWILRRLVTPERRKTFARSHISALHFEEGDVVCGVYKVVARRGGRVEFAMEMPKMGVVRGGRLVVSVERKGEEVVCGSETVMWKDAKEKRKMPLEGGFGKWAHEMAAWWLLDSGVWFLQKIKK